MVLTDCIGSAFNVKGAMQCPNCRKTEKGQWLYAHGSRTLPEFNMDDWAHDDELYDLSYSEMVNVENLVIYTILNVKNLILYTILNVKNLIIYTILFYIFILHLSRQPSMQPFT